jgi:hypothetical protein
MRSLLPAAVAAMIGLWALPALAGPAETAFLGKLAGTWTGTGAVTGTETGSVACKMILKFGADKLGFNGKCDVGDLGPPQSVSGTISYNDKTKRYEAKGNGQTSVGTKSGSTLTFVTKLRQMGAAGTSTMKLSASSIVIDADIGRTGSTTGKYKSHIVLKK